MVTPKEMGRRKMQRPFRPFQVVMKSGERFVIRRQTDYMPLQDEIHLPVEFEGDLPRRGAFHRYEDIQRVELLDDEAEPIDEP